MSTAVRRTAVLAVMVCIATAGCAAEVPEAASPSPTSSAALDPATAEAMRATPLIYASYGPMPRSSGLWIADPDGGAAVPLTEPPSGYNDTHPVRSHDGTRIVFEREGLDDGSVQIGVVEVDDPESLTWIDLGCATVPDCAGDIGPTWSLDDSRIMFQRVIGPFDENGNAASAVLYSAALDGTDLRRLSAEDLPAEFEEVGARPTPDGEYILYLRFSPVDGEIGLAVFRMRPDGTEATQLTPWELNADRPVPSPADSGETAGLFAFETYGGPEPGRGDLVLIPWTCAGVEDCMAQAQYITDNDGGPRSSYAATWSADGLSIAFAEETGINTGYDIWTSRWDGTERQQLTRTGSAVYPCWAS